MHKYPWLVLAVAVLCLIACSKEMVAPSNVPVETTKQSEIEESVSGTPTPETVPSETMELTMEPVPIYDILLTAPPKIQLTDTLSSKKEEFMVDSGSYSWTVRGQQEDESVIACGASPLDDVSTVLELTIPSYNGLDEVIYRVNCVVVPDEILVRAWNKSDIGNTEAQMAWEKRYDSSMIELKKDMVYELVATWSEDKIETRHYAGEGSYVFRTN